MVEGRRGGGGGGGMDGGGMDGGLFDGGGGGTDGGLFEDDICIIALSLQAFQTLSARTHEVPTRAAGARESGERFSNATRLADSNRQARVEKSGSFGRRPSHVRTPSAESISSDIIDDLSSSASTVIFEPSQPPSPTLDLEALAELVKQQTGDNTTLIQLNGALLNALRAERARSDALQQQIESQENKAEGDAAQTRIARARSADAVNNANRNRNAGRFSTAVDENTAASNRPQSAGKIGQLAKYVKPASRRPLVKRLWLARARRPARCAAARRAPSYQRLR